MPQSIFSMSQLRQIEQKAETLEIPLMQQAATIIQNWILDNVPEGSRILMAIGTGNNGGDVLYAADQLSQHNYQIILWVPQEPISEATIEAFEKCKQKELTILQEDNLPAWIDSSEIDLIVDGFFGIGLNRALTPVWNKRIRQINEINKPVLSIDLPSGLDAYKSIAYGEVVKATTTLTFICAKPALYTGMGIDYSGIVHLYPLNIPSELLPLHRGTISPIKIAELDRPMNSHKGLFGTVAIIGGSEGMIGAALLAGRAALGLGAGKVHLGLLANYPVDPIAPELMICYAEEIFNRNFNVLAIGPGLSTHTDAKNNLKKALQTQTPLVIDADALNLIAQNHELEELLIANKQSKILTPHPAEAARLLKTNTNMIQANRIKAAQEIAKKYNAITILKGAGSIIARPDGFYRINTSGSPSLSAAGQGDILTGICSAFLAQDLNSFNAASTAAYIHGLAGEYYAKEIGNIGLSASETINIAKKLLNKLLKNRQNTTN